MLHDYCDNKRSVFSSRWAWQKVVSTELGLQDNIPILWANHHSYWRKSLFISSVATLSNTMIDWWGTVQWLCNLQVFCSSRACWLTVQNNPYKISKHADGDREQLSFQSGYETLMTFSDIIVDIMLIVPKFVCLGYFFWGEGATFTIIGQWNWIKWVGYMWSADYL